MAGVSGWETDTKEETETEDEEESFIHSDTTRTCDYLNWVKAAEGLVVLQQGLAPFVDREVFNMHTLFLKKVPSCVPKGCRCTFENILPDHDVHLCTLQKCLCKDKTRRRRKCPNNYCSTFCQLILNEHKTSDPLWKNSDINAWPTDHWSIAKCYMTTQTPSNTAQTTGASGLLSVIINGKFFQSKVASQLGQPGDVFSKARELQYNIFRRAEMELTDTELQGVLDTCTAVLTDPVSLLKDHNACMAVKKLDSLRNQQLQITTEDETKVLNQKLEALRQQLQETTEMNEACSVAVESVQIKQNVAELEALESIRVRKEKALDDLNEVIKARLGSDQFDAAATRRQTDELHDRLRKAEEKLQAFKSVDSNVGGSILAVKENTLKQKLPGVAEVGKERYLRSVLLLNEGGMFITRHMITNELAKAGKSIDTVVMNVQRQLQREFGINRKQYEKIFPKSGGANIEDWDLELLTKVLSIAFHHRLDQNQRGYIRQLGDIRNEVEHTESPTLDEYDYERIKDDIIYCLRKLSADYDDTTNLKCNEYITRSLEDSLDTQSVNTAQKYVFELAIEKTEYEISKNVDHIVQGMKERFLEGHTKPMMEEEIKVNQEKLLIENILPDGEVFKGICTALGRKSDVVKRMCEVISRKIRESSKNILDVWPAYKYSKHSENNQDDIIFVVITKDELILESFNCKTYQRVENACNKENEIVNEKEMKEMKEGNDVDLDRLVHAINLYDADLMKAHSRLTMILPSSLKSSNFGTEDASIQKSPCIVLYTHIKGLIPISEEPFPSDLDRIPTDVREDCFILCSGGPEAYHEHLKMSCEIGSQIQVNSNLYGSGTLGCFVDHPLHGVCGLTCAHVIFPNFVKMKQNSMNSLFEWVDEGEMIDVFQPSLCTCFPGRRFGRVIKAIFKSSFEENADGADAALIKIEDRQPVDGLFPAPSSTQDNGNPMVYNTGAILTRESLRSGTEVIMFGGKSNRKNGNVQLTTGATAKFSFQGTDIRLRNLILIGTRDFATHGDSGSLVFVNEAEQLKAIGMLEARTTSGQGFVIPISQVLQALGLPHDGLKQF